MHRRASVRVRSSSCLVEEGSAEASPARNKKTTTKGGRRRRYKRPLAKLAELGLGLVASICAAFLIFTNWFTPIQNHHPRYLVWEYNLNNIDKFRIGDIDHDRLLVSDRDDDSLGAWIDVSQEEPTGSSPLVRQEEPLDPCQPMHQWMKETFPTCNSMHEIQLLDRSDAISFINCGGSRCAFRIRDTNGDPIVLKTQKYYSEFTEDEFKDARVDALAMERLSGSPYITQLFCGCASSQLVEYSNGGNIHDLVKLARLEGEETQPPIDRLKIAYQVATALAHVHTFEGDGIVSMTHNDICCHQFMLFDGVYKLTDFHMSTFHRRNQDTHEVCETTTIEINEVLFKLRAPEELFIEDGEKRVVLMDKVDVHMMGNVMYYVLTKKWLFEHVTTEEATKLMVQGSRSEFPEDILNSEDLAIQAVVKAINMCWTHDMEKRPAAREVSALLREALETILGTSDLGVVKVSIPPLPRDYRFTDSDFYVNLGGEL